MGDEVVGHVGYSPDFKGDGLIGEPGKHIFMNSDGRGSCPSCGTFVLGSDFCTRCQAVEDLHKVYVEYGPDLPQDATERLEDILTRLGWNFSA